MKLRTKFILNYSILSLILLGIFSAIIVLSYIKYRQNDFETRLRNRAISTANMLLNVKADSTLINIIDKNTVSFMDDFQIVIYDNRNKIVFTNKSESSLIPIRKSKRNSILNLFVIGYNAVSFRYIKTDESSYIVKVSAVDNYGKNELHQLLRIIVLVIIFSLLFIIGIGFYNALWSLKPFNRIIKEVEAINPNLLKKRLSVKGNDEISQLGKAFNTLLNRIEQSFETEKSFISNASHELRTPVTSILGQIEVGLNKSRTEEEYKAILQSVYDDTTQMTNIINGFLNLAEANVADNQLQMSSVRVDELIFAIIDDFEKKNSNYNITVDYLFSPEVDTQLECVANERLLRILFSNIIDNACKYSSEKVAKITIDFCNNNLVVSVIDHGIGISKDDLVNIFKPLFRGKNTLGNQGHGIGLAIVKRVAELHKITLDIHSELNIGTTILVYIKPLYNGIEV